MNRASEIYIEMKRSIRLGDFSPGYQASEPELADTYGVSRSTIREALVRLEAERFVELIPRRGARVLALHVEDMEEIYGILTIIEPQIAASVAESAPDAESLAVLEQAVTTMEQAIEEPDLDLWAEADDQFHSTLLDLFGNLRLKRMLSDLFDQAHRARMVTLRIRDLPRLSTQEQRDIFEAIRANDPQKASALFRAHRLRSSRELIDALKKTGIKQF